jgi:hypothetical protein
MFSPNASTRQVQERERGITIQSAAVNFTWRDHTVREKSNKGFRVSGLGVQHGRVNLVPALLACVLGCGRLQLQLYVSVARGAGL